MGGGNSYRLSGWTRGLGLKGHYYVAGAAISLCGRGRSGDLPIISGPPMERCGICLGMLARARREALANAATDPPRDAPKEEMP